MRCASARSCFLLMAACATLAGQVNSASLSGVVWDPSGKVAPGAGITAQEAGTEFARSTTSLSNGFFVLTGLSPGVYIVTAEKAGFRSAVAKDVRIEVNHSATLDFHLLLGTGNDAITVSGEVSPVQSTDSSVGYLLRAPTVQALPLEQRNIVGLVTLGPGAIPRQLGGFTHDLNNDLQSGLGAVALNAPINGARSEGNTYVFDGAYDTDRNTFVIAVTPPLESVQEFRIQTSLASADASSASGGVIEVVSKSGSRDFHGNAFEYLRNEALDAHSLFDDPTVAKPRFRQNQFGATLGGPIVRSNTYFFAAYEGLRGESAMSTRHSVPDAAIRLGDFSKSNPIFDPSSLNAAGSRSPFPGGIIPQSRLDPVSQSYLPAYEPLPNQPPGSSSNYIDSTPNQSHADNGSFRLDHQLTPNSRLFARYTINDARGTIAGAFPELPTREELRGQQVALGHTWSGPFWVNEARIAFTRLAVFDTPESAFQTDVISQLGIKGFSSDPAAYGLSDFAVGDFDLVTDSPTLPQTQRDNTWSLSDGFSRSWARHLLRFGVQGTLFQFNYQQSNLVRGRFDYSGQFTNDPNNPSVTGDPFADFLLGYPNRTSRTAGSTQAYLRQHIVAAYVGDDWRATPNLTINLGVRWEYNSPYAKERGDLLNIDYSSLPAAPTLQGYSSSTNPNYFNFAPRAGLAWRLPHWLGTRETVIRAGYGIFFSPEIAIESYSLINNETQNVVNQVSGLTPLLTTTNGFPTNSSFGFPTYFGVDRDAPTSYVQQWNANVQRELGNGWMFEVAYIGTKGTHLGRFRRFNTPQHVEIGENLPPRPGDLQSLRTFPQFGPFLQRQHIANSNYHSLQIKSDKRLDRHFSLLASFVWSKSIDDADSVQPGLFESFGAQDESNLRSERGLSFFNVGRRLSVGFVYNLPSWRFLSGWQASGIFTLQDGTPVNPVYFSTDFANTGTPNRPNVVTGQSASLPPDQRSVDRYFNTAAFADPQQYTFGNAGRDIIPGPGNEVFDFSLHKTFALSETKRLEFRAESFNLFNYQNLGIPGPYPDFGPFFGKILAVGQPRRFQVAVRFGF
jgi:outer membrane receptor protein involved in Fe transport